MIKRDVHKSGKFRATLLELWTRLTEFDKKLKVYLNGADNNYPLEIDRVINNSPTASRASNIMAKFIAGAGVQKDEVINKKTRLKKSDLVRGIALDVAKQYGCFIHVGYKFDIEREKFVPCDPKILDYSKCRISKEDDQENQGKIIVKDWEEKKKRVVGRGSKKEDKEWYYPFSNKQSVIISQIKADAKDAESSEEDISELIKHYRGQVYYLNLTPQYVYAISLFDCVFNDCDTEYRMSLYSNNVTRTGFQGKLAVLTQGLDEEIAQKVDEDIAQWLGAEESGNIFRLDIEETTNLKDVLHIEQIKSQYDEKQYSETRKSCRVNIMGAANNIPETMIYNSGGLFAQSGEAYIQQKIFYQEQTEFERKSVEETMKMLSFDCEIIPLVEQEQEQKKK